ncbi:MAG: methyltransferase domain-containing protein [Candidatus Lindowbacteria bacterium]|nr:methyltransferase domain-containing protein [Candidatus Lindowbacteria bacterium]
MLSHTGERTRPEGFTSVEEYLIYLRSLFAYESVKDRIAGSGLVLEIGCGEGFGAGLLSKHVRKIIGLDVDENTVLHASKKYRSASCSFVTYGGRRLPFRDNTFDVVISFQVVEHVPDDTGFISEAHRVLKTKGSFHITTPNRTHRLRNGTKPWNKFHLREYYPNEFERILRNRFESVNVWGIRGSEEIEKIEKQRIKDTLRLRALDPLGLREFIPEPLRVAIRAAMRRAAGKDLPVDERLSAFRASDYHIVKDNLSDSLDLLGICTK